MNMFIRILCAATGIGPQKEKGLNFLHAANKADEAPMGRQEYPYKVIKVHLQRKTEPEPMTHWMAAM